MKLHSFRNLFNCLKSMLR